jgi:hypothetical protein
MALVALAGAVLLVLATPESLWAWGPTTHAWLSSQVLGNLQLLPLVVREILEGHPYSYLYGSLSADITLPSQPLQSPLPQLDGGKIRSGETAARRRSPWAT